MQATELKPETFRHVEAELYAYKETKREILRLREEILHSTEKYDENDRPGRNSHRTPLRPTERIATRLTTDRRLRNLEEIVEAIDAAYDQVPEDYKLFIRTMYWEEPGHSLETIAAKCNMHRNTASKYRKEFIYLVAEKVGWR